MGRLLYKMLCPSHEEDTPSCAVYEDGTGWCFGCNMHFAKLDDPKPVEPVIPEDLNEKIKYIRSLDKIQYRGLDLPSDKEGYYVLWPRDEYYKLRRWDATMGDLPKYRGARGIKKPWFCFNPDAWISGKKSLAVVVEGEINAMSLNVAYPDLPVFCPGGAGNFTDATSNKMLPILTNYDEICIIVDEDMAGVNAAIKLKGLLQPNCRNVVIELMEQDVNSILVNKGVQGIKETLRLTESV